MGTVIQGCSDNSTSTNPKAQAVPETDVLNFASNLEYLEAEFYSVAVTGGAGDRAHHILLTSF